jgi:hypothetical protein
MVVEPMVVEIVELPRATSRGGGGTGGGHARHVASTTGREGGTDRHEASGAGDNLMTMRGPEGPSFGLSPQFIAHFLAESKPVPPKDTEAERIADDIAADREALDDPEWVAHASPDQVMRCARSWSPTSIAAIIRSSTPRAAGGSRRSTRALAPTSRPTAPSRFVRARPASTSPTG